MQRQDISDGRKMVKDQMRLGQRPAVRRGPLNLCPDRDVDHVNNARINRIARIGRRQVDRELIVILDQQRSFARFPFCFVEIGVDFQVGHEIRLDRIA